MRIRISCGFGLFRWGTHKTRFCHQAETPPIHLDGKMRLSPYPESFKPSILEILNEAIAHTTAIYDYRPRSLESMDSWFQTKINSGFPVPASIRRIEPPLASILKPGFPNAGP